MAGATAWAATNGTRDRILTADVEGMTLKMALFTSSSNLSATSTTFAGVTNEVAAANGYTAGGISVTMTATGTTTVAVTLVSNPVWTASGGSITARFAAIYEVSGNVLCFCTLDSTPADVVTGSGNTLTIVPSGSGVISLA